MNDIFNGRPGICEGRRKFSKLTTDERYNIRKTIDERDFTQKQKDKMKREKKKKG